MKIRGVVFDLDGTLVSQELDFEAIRHDMGLPTGTPLLEALDQMAPAERDRAARILDQHEQSAAVSRYYSPLSSRCWIGSLAGDCGADCSAAIRGRQ